MFLLMLLRRLRDSLGWWLPLWFYFTKQWSSYVFNSQVYLQDASVSNSTKARGSVARQFGADRKWCLFLLHKRWCIWRLTNTGVLVFSKTADVTETCTYYYDVTAASLLPVARFTTITSARNLSKTHHITGKTCTHKKEWEYKKSIHVK